MIRDTSIRREKAALIRSETGAPIRSDTGRVVRNLGNIREPTDAQRAERRGRSQGLEAVAHDLRDPIYTIRLAAEVLAGADVDDAQRDRLVGAILRSADMVQDMIGNLLDLDRIEEGRLPLELEPLDIHSLLEQTRDRFRLEAEQGNITIETEPSPGPPLRGRVDRGLLDRVLSNLIRNALVHAGGDRVTLSVAPAPSGMLRLAVRDTGRGIPPEERDKVFRRFWRTRVDREEGLGLGLSIVKASVELLGGRAWVESEVGTGTTFYFTVPADLTM